MSVRKSSSKPKAKSFADKVMAHAKASSTEELAKALGDVTLKRLHSKAVARLNRIVQRAPVPQRQETTQRRRSARRLGKYQRYEATSKVDISRHGTFRRYMISTIRAHTDTHSANEAHASCDNPSFAKNRLDFNWAADNGYINFI